MTLRSTAAFVASTTTRSLLRTRPLARGTESASLDYSTQLWAGPLANHAATASSFFTSIRVPAALIAGSSLAAFFTLVDRAQESRIQEQSRIENVVLLLYHFLATISLMLSLNVVVTATATGNALLLGYRDPMATSAYALLEREYYFEFLVTRWSFFSSLFAFLGCITTRALLEFDLLKPRRWRSCTFVVSSVGALFFHLLSFVNERLEFWQNMGRMTWDVVRHYAQRALSKSMWMQSISLVLAITSVVSFFMAMKCSMQTNMWSGPARLANGDERAGVNAATVGSLSNVLSATAEQQTSAANSSNVDSATDDVGDQAVN